MFVTIISTLRVCFIKLDQRTWNKSYKIPWFKSSYAITSVELKKSRRDEIIIEERTDEKNPEGMKL